MSDKKRRFVHCNSLKRFIPANCLNDTIDTIADLESSDSEEELDCFSGSPQESGS